MTYIFYENGKVIAEADLSSKKAADEKAAELAYALSYAMKHPRVTYKEADNGKEII